MPLLEPVDRQAEQSTRDVRRKSVTKCRARDHEHERTQQGCTGIDEREQPETERQHRQQVPIERGQDIVDRQLHVIGRGQHEDLQHEAEHEHLGKGALHPGHAPPELRKSQSLALAAGLEVRAGPQFQRDAGEMPGNLRHRQPGRPAIRIMDEGLARGHPFQHHIMVHVPVQDAGDMEVGELLQRQLHCARRKADLVRKTDQRTKRGTAQTGREAATQRAQIDVQAVIIGNHRQRGEAAFRDLGLAHQAHARTA